MAKLGFHVIDSDIHVVEPKDLCFVISNRNSSKTVRNGQNRARIVANRRSADSGSCQPCGAPGRHRHTPPTDQRKIQETRPARRRRS
jgi:hypothetical protein